MMKKNLRNHFCCSRLDFYFRALIFVCKNEDFVFRRNFIRFREIKQKYHMGSYDSYGYSNLDLFNFDVKLWKKGFRWWSNSSLRKRVFARKVWHV